MTGHTYNESFHITRMEKRMTPQEIELADELLRLKSEIAQQEKELFDIPACMQDTISAGAGK